VHVMAPIIRSGTHNLMTSLFLV